jgi:hypothetical protein
LGGTEDWGGYDEWEEDVTENRSSGDGIEDKHKFGTGDVGDAMMQRDQDLLAAQVL